MNDHDAHLVPTLVTYEADAKYGPSFGWTEENSSKNAEVLSAGLTSLENALSNGVNVGYGTDYAGRLKVTKVMAFLYMRKFVEQQKPCVIVL